MLDDTVEIGIGTKPNFAMVYRGIMINTGMVSNTNVPSKSTVFSNHVFGKTPGILHIPSFIVGKFK
jgi:hypothetical protein